MQHLEMIQLGKALKEVLPVFKDNVPEKAPSEFPGSACLTLQALLMNGV